ncbi:MAG: hypothetical protein ACI4CY_02020 [Candidatus Gastranaerophilaceae bacterium]
MFISSESALTMLLAVSSVAVVVVAVFLVRFLVELVKLTEKLNFIASSVQNDLAPALAEIKKALTNINSITSSAENKFNNVKHSLAKVVAVGAAAAFGMKGFTRSFFTGLKTGFDLFRKK